MVYIKTGSVKSNILQTHKAKMPENSYYEPLRDLIDGSLLSHMDKMMPAELYAKKVADKVLGQLDKHLH